MLKAEGAGAEAMANQLKIQKVMFTAAKEKDDKAAMKKFEELYKGLVAELSEEDKKVAAKQEKDVMASFREVITPWFRYFLAHDPRPALRKVECPVLALFGEKDTQVTPADNLQPVTAALKESGNKDVTIKVVPGVNHLFQTCKTGGVSEYSQIEETIAPQVLELVSDWVLKRVGPR
jgi:fermentation-respiration switch protein FrsA (DUF1100 family)